LLVYPLDPGFHSGISLVKNQEPAQDQVELLGVALVVDQRVFQERERGASAIRSTLVENGRDRRGANG
jgi:hypothetical protein